MARFLITLIFLAGGLFAATAADAPIVLDAVFEPEFETVLRAEPLLLTDGGARIIEREGVRYFFAVGVTTVGAESSAERLRRVRVGRVNALRAAAEFTAPTEVKTETTLRETTTVRRENGVSSGETRKTLDDVTRTKVEALLRALPEIGSWKSADGKLFFYALGAKLP